MSYGTSLNDRETKPQGFIQVKNNSGSAFAVGDVVEWDVDSATGEDLGISVRDAQAGSVLVAGVVVEAIPDGGFGRIQNKGFCDNVTTDGTITEGDTLIAGTKVADQGADASNPAAVFGVALIADSSNTLTAAILDCRGAV